MLERLMTVEDLYALPENGRHHELQAGLLISEPPPGVQHGIVAARVVWLLLGHVRPRKLGAVLSNDTGYVLARCPDTVRGPDVSFVSRDRIERLEDPHSAFPGAPDLAVEVVSPGDRPADVHAKVADYLAAGTRLVWILEPQSKTVTAYRSLLVPEVLGPARVLDGGEVLPEFRVTVADLFEV